MKITDSMLNDLNGFGVVDTHIVGCSIALANPDEKTELLWLRTYAACEPYHSRVTIYDVVDKVRKRGYKPATVAQLLEFGKKPAADGGSWKKIIAPDTEWIDQCGQGLCIINGNPRKLKLVHFSHHPHLDTEECCYLVVKDSSKPAWQ